MQCSPVKEDEPEASTSVTEADTSAGTSNAANHSLAAPTAANHSLAAPNAANHSLAAFTSNMVDQSNEYLSAVMEQAGGQG